MRCSCKFCLRGLKVPVKTWLLPVLAILQTTSLTNAEIRADQFETSMTIGTWGGPYEAAQENALFAPFEQSSGIDIRISHYTGGLDIFDQPSPPDILDMLKEDAELACEKKLLKPIDLASLSQARISNKSAQKALHAGELDTTDDFAKHDFYEGVFAPCSVAHSTFSTLIAYDERAFTGEKPTRINDLFDLERFPGKRALQRSPAALFEWAMMAEDVPTSQIYDLLSTERGLRLVLKNLEKLRDHIIWWETPEDAVSLLEQGEAVMASGYNGRFFNAWSRGVPINMIWDGQIIDRSVWAIASTSTINTNNALSFLRFALHPQRLAHMARQIPYGPLRPSAFRYIGLNQDTGIDMRDHLPTADHHLTNALHRDTRWYARTFSLRHTYFTRWVEANGE